jgi:hypothetical protein
MHLCLCDSADLAGSGTKTQYWRRRALAHTRRRHSPHPGRTLNLGMAKSLRVEECLGIG